jgi:hypothetical protein
VHSVLASPLGFIHDHLVLLGTLLALFVLIAIFTPEVFGQVFDSLGKIGGILYQGLAEIWGIYCVLTFIPWKFVYVFRAIFFTTTLGVVSLSALHILLDSVPVSAALAEEFPNLSSPLIALKEFLKTHQLSLRTDLIILALAIIVFWHTIVEFFHSLRREEVPKFLGELIIELDKFRKQNPSPNETQKNAYLQKLIANTQSLLDEKGRRKIMISIMGEETAKDAKSNPVKTGYLKIDPIPTGTKLDVNLRLRVVAENGETNFEGEGGAGRAFYHKVPVYIPKVFYQVGIRLDKVRSLGPTYKKSDDQIPLRSILSVPVLVPQNPVATAGGGAPASRTPAAVAVITASSSRSHAFTRDDIRILELAAVFISTLY